MSRYLLLFGRQPEFGFAEANACAERVGAVLEPSSRIAAVLTGVDDAAGFFAHLGGSVKIVALSEDEVWKARSGKIVFGVSVYGANAERRADEAAKRVKAELLEAGKSVRYVRGKAGILSSVVVEKQGLLKKGAEMVIVGDGKDALTGRTVAVQAFEEFSKRDYGRPERDAKEGMLPPKLGRMMINCSGVSSSSTLLDPFCGSGTVLQEAAFLGFQNIVGSDNSEHAVRRSKTNLSWLKKSARLFHTSVSSLSKELHGELVDAVVTEPYLGPPQKGMESLTRIMSDLEQLYRDAFRAFDGLLKPGGRVVFLFPVFYRTSSVVPMPNIERIVGPAFRFLPAIPEGASLLYTKDLSPRGTLLYHRPGQRVGREVVILEKR